MIVPEFVILRVSEKLHATYGLLMENNEPWLLTLEDPWLQNQQNISCIPPGPYHCKRFHSEKHPDTFEIMNVPERTGILFHAGNTPEDTQGCVLLGSEWDRSNKETIILKSQKAMMKFMARLNNVNAFNLYIRKAP